MVGPWVPLLRVGWPVGWWARLLVVHMLLLLWVDGSVGRWARLLVGTLLLRLQLVLMVV